MIKPAFSGGGSRGVFVAQNWDEARVQLEKLRNKYLDSDVVIEEFIYGTEHIRSPFLQRQSIFAINF